MNILIIYNCALIIYSKGIYMIIYFINFIYKFFYWNDNNNNNTDRWAEDSIVCTDLEKH